LPDLSPLFLDPEPILARPFTFGATAELSLDPLFL